MQALLGRVLNFDHLRSGLESGALSALAITASGYTSGEHLTFYQGATACRSSHGHRSPAAGHSDTDHGRSLDGLIRHSVRFSRQADYRAWQGRVVRRRSPCGNWRRSVPPFTWGRTRHQTGTGFRDDTHPEHREDAPPYPSLAQVGGHALSSIFLMAGQWTSSAWNG